MRNFPKSVTYTPGRVQVNHGYKVLAHKDVIIYEFDLRTKYARVLCVAGQTAELVDKEFVHGREVEIVLYATEDTLRADGPEGYTTLTIKLPKGTGYWDYLAQDIGKYTLTICFFKRPTTED